MLEDEIIHAKYEATDDAFKTVVQCQQCDFFAKTEDLSFQCEILSGVQARFVFK